jgi:hypothetical protein
MHDVYAAAPGPWQRLTSNVLCRVLRLLLGVMDEKTSATTALGWYAEACPRAFMPYAEESLQVLTTMSQYWHDEARAAAFDSLQKLTLAAHGAFPPAGGEPVVLSEQTRVLSEQVLPLLISCVEDDCSKPAVGAAAAALAQMLKQLGRGAVGPTFLEGAANMAQLVMQNKAVCQVGRGKWTALCLCRN